MEKVVYVLWPTVDEGVELRSRLLGKTAAALVAAGARGLQVNIADDDVEPAAGLRLAGSSPLPSAVVSVWMDSAIDELRQPFDTAVGAAAGEYAAYLVTESEPIRNTRHPVVPGRRTEGFAQIAFLRRPVRLAATTWRSIWQDQHTRVAIDTQDTFGYVQNVVVRALTQGAPPYDGIVEELFPAAAMSDRHAFFDAVGDDDRLAENFQAMIASSGKFLDLEGIEVMPTSQYALLQEVFTQI